MIVYDGRKQKQETTSPIGGKKQIAANRHGLKDRCGRNRKLSDPLFPLESDPPRQIRHQEIDGGCKIAPNGEDKTGETRGSRIRITDKQTPQSAHTKAKITWKQTSLKDRYNPH